MFTESEPKPDYVCRSGDKKRVEIQADQFAANLLMPREFVRQSWLDWRGSSDPLALSDVAELRDQILAVEHERRGIFKPSDDAADDVVLEYCSRPLAEKFQVSAKAMRRRLEEMGLLVRKKEASLFS